MWMQPAFGPLKDRVIALHNLVLVIITVITLFVAGLLAWVMYRYNGRRIRCRHRRPTTRSSRWRGR